MLLFVGRLSEEKGIRLLFGALAKILRYFPGVRLHIAGDGREKKKYEQLARKFSAVSRIIYRDNSGYDLGSYDAALKSMRKERDAKDLYLSNAERAPTEMTKILFKRLAKQEEEHEKKLHAAMDILREEIDRIKHGLES